MKNRLALVSLAALAWADAAAAQPAAMIQPGGVPGMVDEGPAAIPSAAPEPVLTDIRADRNNPLALGTQVTQAGRTHIIDGGTRAGNNLFHSFSRFDLGQGDLARWVHSAGDPASIRNVVNRVTGGDPSHIFGTLDSTALPNADFYFMNPAGIIFGEGASIDVPAAAHFSTAHALRFAAGPAFTIATPGGSTLSVANPAAFGFVGGEGNLVGRNTGSLVTGGTQVSLSAANVSLSQVEIVAGGIRLAATGGAAAEVPLDRLAETPLAGRIDLAGVRQTAADEAHDTQLRAFGADGLTLAAATVTVERTTLAGTAQGSVSPGITIAARDEIRLRDAAIRTGPIDLSLDGGGGSIALRSSGRIDIGGGTRVGTDTGAQHMSIPGGSISIEAPSILIGGEDGIDRRALIGTSAFGVQQGGAIRIRGGRLDVRNADLTTFALQGDGGAIQIAMSDSVLLDDAALNTTTAGAGFGTSGDIQISAPSVRIVNGSLLGITALGSGATGSAVIEGGLVELADSRIETVTGGLGCEPCGDINDAGSVFVAADRLRLRSSSITADTRGQGLGGLISVTAGEAELFASSISSNALAGGKAGQVSVDAGRLLLDGSSIASTTAGPGAAGMIRIDADAMRMIGDSQVTTSAACRDACGSLGAAGDIAISGASLTMTAGPEGSPLISSDTAGPGAAGRIDLAMTAIAMDGGVISSSTSGSGAGGTITVETDTLTMGRARLLSDTQGPGAGGSITVNARVGITLADDARIVASSFRGGAGGTITIGAPSLTVINASKLLTETNGRSPAGSIVLRGDRLLLAEASTISSSTSGLGAGGSIDIDADDVTVSGSFIHADSFNGEEPGGRAGSLTIRADRLTLRSEETDGETIRSVLSSSTVTDADAGQVTLLVGELVIDNSELESETRSDGQAGTVTIAAQSIDLRNRARVSTASQRVPGCMGCDETPTGNAGSIQIDVAGRLSITGGSEVLSSTGEAGNAGTIAIAAREVVLIDGRIASSTDAGSSGASGQVGVEAERLRVVNGSIETISRNANRAGDLGIVAGEVSLAGPLARIASSNESAAPGAAGTVLIAGPRLLTLLDGARITTSSAAGAAGDILISMPGDGLLTLQSADPRRPSLITTSSGPGTGGVIAISDPRAIISNGGSILALGEQGGANVQLDGQYLISSSDRLNRIEVSGNFLLEAAAYDVSAGTVNRDLSVIDASGVLRGQCAAVRQTGQVSQLVVRPIGPYGARPTSAAPDRSRLLTAAGLQPSCS